MRFMRKENPKRGGQFWPRKLVCERMGIQVQFDPDEHSTARPIERIHFRFRDHGPFCVGRFDGRRLFELKTAILEDCTHPVHASFVHAAQTFEPANPAVGFPSLEGVLLRARFRCERASDDRWLWAHDHFGDHALHETGGLLGGRFGDAEDAFDDGRLGGNPAETTSWCDRFGESIQPDHSSISVKIEVRRY